STCVSFIAVPPLVPVCTEHPNREAPGPGGRSEYRRPHPTRAGKAGVAQDLRGPARLPRPMRIHRTFSVGPADARTSGETRTTHLPERAVVCLVSRSTRTLLRQCRLAVVLNGTPWSCDFLRRRTSNADLNGDADPNFFAIANPRLRHRAAVLRRPS